MKPPKLIPLALVFALGCHNYVPNRTVKLRAGTSADAAFLAVLSVVRDQGYRQISVDEEHRCVRTAAKLDGDQHFYSLVPRDELEKVSYLELCVTDEGDIEVRAAGAHIKNWAGPGMHRKLRQEINGLASVVLRTSEAQRAGLASSSGRP